MVENFNPYDKKYKKVEDLPEDQQKKFVNEEGGGFITKEAKEYDDSNKREAEMLNEERAFLEKIFNRNEVSYLDFAHGEALQENWVRGIAGREKLVKDLSSNLGRTPEDVEAFIDRCDEIMSSVPHINENEVSDLTHLQRKIKGRLEGALKSYKKGDAVDAVMYLSGLTKRIQEGRLDKSYFGYYPEAYKLVMKLYDNADKELITKLKEAHDNQRSASPSMEEGYYREGEYAELLAESSRIWREEVVPILIEILKKSEKY